MISKFYKSWFVFLFIITITAVFGQTETNTSVIITRPDVNVTGFVDGSDAPTVGLAGATIELTATSNYTGTTDATGHFTIAGIPDNTTYNYTISKTGYNLATGSINVSASNYNMGTITLVEAPFPPTAVHATEESLNVNVSWIAPNPGALSVMQSFEGTIFPPANWTQVVTNTGPVNIFGVLPTWCRVSTINLDTGPIVPQDGAWQASMWWAYTHQDEWLITPQFNCPTGASLIFHGLIFLGSVNNDHHYVKVSTNNGADWTILWDAVAAGGFYYSDYSIPFTISLADYAGQNIKLAWHADDPPNNGGMWHFAMIDNISVSSPNRTITFNEDEMEIRSAVANTSVKITKSNSAFVSKTMSMGRNDRVLTGYKVWRLTAGQETNESEWDLLTQNSIISESYQDNGWDTVPDGTYRWAVKSLYTNSVLSVPAFSNPITKLTQIGTIAGIVRQTDNTPIMGATVTAGSYTAITNALGAYAMQVPAGIYDVTCAAVGFIDGHQDGVTVITDLTTTINFVLAEAFYTGDDFEVYTDFAIDFLPWVNVDVDQSETYGLSGYDFPGEYQAMAFIIFNPSTTVPPSTAFIGAPHGGAKMAQCWAASTPPNNDWMISRNINVNIGANIGFWARSLTADYGLERFKVGISTGGTLPSQFTIISPGTFVQAPVEWTYFQYNIPSSFIPGNIRVGINCVSNDAFVFMVDDFVVDQPTISARRTQYTDCFNFFAWKLSQSFQSGNCNPLFF